MEQNALADIVADVDRLRELIEASEEFTQLIHSPVLSPQFKSETFQQLFTDAMHPLTINFFRLLTLKQRERYLTAIMDLFSVIVDEAAGRLVAQVTTAVPLTSEASGTTYRATQRVLGKASAVGNHNRCTNPRRIHCAIR